mgnify:CR=1 FL=1
MSGHSHASTIKHDKEVTDAKRGTAFSKVGRLITVAVKENGGLSDPTKNAKLKVALEKAKEVNMPKDNIQRAIERGSGKADGAILESITYEGFGPGGTAMLLECITDNKFRTGAEIKNLFSSAGGNLAEPGAASHFFERKGLIKLLKEGGAEDQMLKLIDLGAEDIEEREEGFFSVFVPVEQLENFKNRLVAAQFKIQSAEMVLKPKSKLSASPEDSEKIKKFQQKLLDHDDVLKVFINL